MTVCDCDTEVFPTELVIAPGLTRLPRQIGIFADFRRSMLGRVRAHPALAGWQARRTDDFGLMMLEWWAYVADVVAFYNSELVQDLYLASARADAALRKLTDLIGYEPRPATAAEAFLAAIADGEDPVEAAAGTGFVSDAIDDTPPQVFEVSALTLVDPRRNEWTVAPIPAPDGTIEADRLLLDPASRNIAEEQLVVFDDGAGTPVVLRVASITPQTEIDGRNYLLLTVTDAAAVPAMSRRAVRLWSFTQSAPVHSGSGSVLTLTGLFPQVRTGELVVVEDTAAEGAADPVVATVSSVSFDTIDLAPGGSGVTEELALNGGGSGGGTTSDPGTLPSATTKVTLSASTGIPGNRAKLHFGRVRAGRLAVPPKARIAGTDLQGGVALAGRSAPPTLAGTGEVLLHGSQRKGQRVAATVQVDADTGVASLTPGGAFVSFTDPLRTPVLVHGNLLHVTRGETVDEVLGSGGGPGRPFQTFTLAKKPLTYVVDPSARGGRRSTLRIWCDGVEWHEVDSLFTAGPTDRVYTVTLDGTGEATITFGDGTFGMPAPLGAGNVYAVYRHGAGDPPPGADQIKQIAGPVPNLRRVFNPTAAFGGGEGDQPDDIRWNAPASAATFDRAVSAADFAALARDFGALAAVAVSEWMPTRLRVGVHVTAIFDGEVTPEATQALEEHLAARAAETLPIEVTAAVASTGLLRLSYRSRSDAGAADVRDRLDQRFNDPFTGVLSPRRAAIGGPVFRSALLGVAAKVTGVETVLSLTLDGAPVPERIPLGDHEYFAPDTDFVDVAG